MDSVSILLAVVVGAVVVWLFARAFSNARHSPPRKHRGGPFGGGGAPGVVSFSHAQDPEPPGSRRSDERSR